MAKRSTVGTAISAAAVGAAIGAAAVVLSDKKNRKIVMDAVKQIQGKANEQIKALTANSSTKSNGKPEKKIIKSPSVRSVSRKSN